MYSNFTSSLASLAHLGNLLFEVGPVPAIGGGDAPQVELELSLGRGGPSIGFVGSLLLRELCVFC